jgi:DNA polymerase III sliding clamp (beta) subunit (PCNA family)
MNIEVAKQDLEAALKVTATTVGSGSDLTSHYLFRIHGGCTEVLSYSMRVFSRSAFTSNADGSDGDAFTVEAWRLDKWISSVGDGVLTLSSGEKGEVIAKGPRSKIKLRSLDPSRFPFWDGLLANASSMGNIDPAVLHRAISLSKTFVSTDDTNRPEISQIEARDGVMQATNRRAVSSVKIRDLPGLSLRIPGKDLTTVLKFLSDKATTGDVKVMEGTREGTAGAAIIFERLDGSYVGVSRPTNDMPSLPVVIDEPTMKLSLDVDEFMGAVGLLLSSAPKGQETVSFASKGGTLVISMPSDAGGVDEYPLISSTETGLNDITFGIDYSYIRSLADQFDLDTLDIGVHERGRGGYVSFLYEDEGSTEDSGNQYHTVIVWRH